VLVTKCAVAGKPVPPSTGEVGCRWQVLPDKQVLPGAGGEAPQQLDAVPARLGKALTIRWGNGSLEDKGLEVRVLRYCAKMLLHRIHGTIACFIVK
jgi:hypothetical protein